MTGHGSAHRYRPYLSTFVPRKPGSARPADVMALSTALGLLVLAAIFYLDPAGATSKALDMVRLLAGTIPIMGRL
jgi:hypothetical protein